MPVCGETSLLINLAISLSLPRVRIFVDAMAVMRNYVFGG